MLKKYYSIGEVSQILGVPTSMLRKLDSIRSMDAKITRIRGRRYYTKANITGAARLLTELRKAEFRLDRTQLLDTGS
jgi:DNA-binding transcriptional MerR regulator